MKKLLTLFAAILTLAACSNQDDAMPASQTSIKKTSYIRSFDEALQIAQSSISILDGSEITRSGSTRKINLDDSKVYKQDALTRSASDTNDTLMYVFNFEDNQGFAVIAANRNTDALIAVTEKGHYDPGETTEIEGFNDFTQAVENYLRNMANTPKAVITEVREERVYTGHHTPVVGPYVSVKWGQQLPEGEFCPNLISGCTNTAMAQIMSHFEYPTSIYLTYGSNNSNLITLDWSSIKSHSTGHSLNYCTTSMSNAHSQISSLCRQLGEMNNSTYHFETNSTSASTSTYTTIYAIPTFTSLGYSTGSWNNINNTNITSELSNGHLLLARGTDTLIDSGHAWVVDGYTSAEYYVKVYHRENVGPINPWILYETLGPAYTTLYHVNWGWYGKNNGYYAFGIFDTSKVIIPDTDYNNTLLDFSSNLRFLPVYR